MSGSRISSLVLSRPSVSGQILPIGSARVDLPSGEAANIFGPVFPPSDEEITRLIRTRVRTHFANDGKIELDGFVLFYAVVIDQGSTLIYTVVGEPGLSRDNANRFLEASARVITSSTQLSMLLNEAGEYELQPQIQPIFLQSIKEHNSRAAAPQDSRITALRAQVNDVRSVMADNVERIMERGERLDNMALRSEELQATSASFKSTARRVQRHFCHQNAKWTIISVAILLALTTLITLLILHHNNVI
ncbi:unnamed protein product [Caenorhabditis auriculariae]|uniref:V-SNARE coiled-coil homology domain-containing protein n=1 Tax=Caenorhabditis auriculariae TaxID=2777116 RepID=A0A8S1H9H1_9PELO|nr:unnamed protein product [Caenorhabditis auriculariae]